MSLELAKMHLAEIARAEKAEARVAELEALPCSETALRDSVRGVIGQYATKTLSHARAIDAIAALVGWVPTLTGGEET